MHKNPSLLLLLGATVVSFAAHANDPATLADLQAANAKRLGGDEVRALVAGKRSENVSRQGSRREFEHDADGKIRGRLHSQGARAAGIPGEGTWSIDGNGRYCIDMKWSPVGQQPIDEKWCGAIWQAGESFYAVVGGGADARAWKQGFRR